MSCPKFSIVSIGIHSKVMGWIVKYKPVSALIVNERGESRPERPWEDNEIDLIRQTMAASPKTLWIFRSWPDGIGENIPNWPLWDRLIKCFEPFRDMPNPLMAHGYNEPGFPWVNSVNGAKALANIEIKFAERIHQAGLLYAGLCFPESHLGRDNVPLWEHLVLALSSLDAWCPNEYDWPTPFTSRDGGYKWRIGHWEHQAGEIRKHTNRVPPIIIGEGILDGKVAKMKDGEPYGWKNRYPARVYVEMHQQVHDDTYHRPEVFSHHTFCYCGEESEWRTYNVRPILEDLGKLIQGQVYWKEEAKMENPITVGIRQDYTVWDSPIVDKKTMEMEEYLRYCLPYEMYASWKPEALKAGAIAARTYATWMKTHGKHWGVDLCNSACCQVMGPKVDSRTDRAVKETEGVIITYRGEPIKAMYFSFCDGHTTDGGLPYLKPQPCGCRDVAPKGTPVAKHNNGLCQWGAQAMALQSATAKEILFHYYGPEIEIGGEKAVQKEPDDLQKALGEIAKAKEIQRVSADASRDCLEKAEELILSHKCGEAK